MKNEKLQMKNKTWRKVKLGEILEITSSKRIFMSEYKKSGIPFYRGKEIIEKYNGAKEVSMPLYISKEKFSEIKHKFGAPKENDILLTSVGTLGIPYLIKRGERFYFKDGNLTWFRNYSDDTDPKFIYYWLTSRVGKNSILASSIGSSQQALTIDGLKKVEINLPRSRSDQKRIADILSAFDDKIELNNKISKNLEQTAQAIFKEWFVKFKFPGHEKVKMVDLPAEASAQASSELGKIPEGWGVKKIKDVCNQIVNGGTPRREITEYWANGTIPWVTTSELQDRVILNTNEKISKFGHKNSSTKLLPKNTIIIALYASPTLGRLGLLKIEATTNQACSALVASKRTGYGYLFYWLLSQREYLQGLAVGAAQQNINQEVIRELNIIVPDEGILGKFQEVISGVFDSLTNTARENQKLAALRDLLLPKLMSGEIRV